MTGVHIDTKRQDDDAGIIYKSQGCGYWHYRCYLCEPAKKSRFHSRDGETAVRAFQRHCHALHPGGLSGEVTTE